MFMNKYLLENIFAQSQAQMCENHIYVNFLECAHSAS